MFQIFLVIVALLLACVVAFAAINRPYLVVVDAPPPDEFPPDGFSHGTFEALLRKYVDDCGRVRYAEWHASTADRQALDRYLAAVSRYSPETSPERFRSRNDELAYWVYTYNAVVIRSILTHWPIGSVTDVRAPLELVKGLGFFWQQRFLFGGKTYSLYGIENDLIRREFHDARIHFVLYCGSNTCPGASSELPHGDELDEFLQRAAKTFVSAPKNIQIDHVRQRIILSPIFKWYRKDFVGDLERPGTRVKRGLIRYLQSVASASVQSELESAHSYVIRFRQYDWSLNHGG